MIKTERTRNTNDDPNHGTVDVNSSTAQTLVAANPDRIGLTVSNPHNQGLWIRPYPASDDNDEVGIYLAPNQPPYEIKADNIITTEYSIIMNQGGTKTIPFVEY